MKARCVRSLEEAAAGSRRRQPAGRGFLIFLIKQPRRGDRAIGLLAGSRVGIDLDYCLNVELLGLAPVATSWLRAGRPRFPWAVAQGYLLSPLRGLGGACDRGSYAVQIEPQSASSSRRKGTHCFVDLLQVCIIRAEQHCCGDCRSLEICLPATRSNRLTFFHPLASQPHHDLKI